MSIRKDIAKTDPQDSIYLLFLLSHSQFLLQNKGYPIGYSITTTKENYTHGLMPCYRHGRLFFYLHPINQWKWAYYANIVVWRRKHEKIIL